MNLHANVSFFDHLNIKEVNKVSSELNTDHFPKRLDHIQCIIQVSYFHSTRGCVIPVFEEPVDAECHELQQGLDDEDDGKHVVAVLQDLLQVLKTQKHKQRNRHCLTSDRQN